MSGQLAKLFIRGSLINVTAKNLTEKQNEQVLELIDLVWNDRDLDNARHKFCYVLDSTIGNEYKDKDFAMHEVIITLWRTAVDVLFHKPRPRVVNDPGARRKYFKTCIFNYMRQILAENKIPTYRYNRTITGTADIVAKESIQFYLENLLTKPIDYEVESYESLNSTINTTRFNLDVNLVPVNVMKKIWALRDEIKEFGIRVQITDIDITVLPEETVRSFSKKVSEKVRVKSFSISGIDQDDGNNNFQQHCEHKARKKREVELDSMLIQDSIQILSKRLPSPAARVFQILVNTPEDFQERFYPHRKKDVRPREKHIAEYLGLSKSEVAKAMDLIKKQAVALDII